MEDLDLQVIQLEGEDGEVVNCVVAADLEMDGQVYVALQVVTEDPSEEVEVILCKLTSNPEDEDSEIMEFLEEGEEFDKVAAAFTEAFESIKEEEGEE